MRFSKIYRYDEKELKHVELSRRGQMIFGVSMILLGLLVGIGIPLLLKETEKKVAKTIEYEELVILLDEAENELMSPKNLYEYMQEIGIKYPEIVWSQVALESRFCSQVCKENNNYFGMKRATCRPNVQTGENLGHATYHNWKMSVIDYALWQATIGGCKFKSEAAYFNYLDQHYAEGQNYALKVKEIRDNFDFYLNSYEEKFRNGKLK